MKSRWLVVVVGALGAALVARGDDAKTDADEFQDTWRIVAVEAGGEKKELGEAAREGKARVVITADKIAIRINGGFAQLDQEMTYKMDAGKKPRTIDVTFTRGADVKGKTWQGIYSLRGDKLKICFDIGGKERPSTFETKKEGDGLLLYYLERE